MSEDAVLIEYPVQKRSEEVLQWDLMRSEVESVSPRPLNRSPQQFLWNPLDFLRVIGTPELPSGKIGCNNRENLSLCILDSLADNDY